MKRAVRSGSRQRRRMMDFYVGFDVSQEATNICVIDGDGKVV
ncbi:putative NBD/HSP70 family sugar kinase [Bradyrhizobium sp. USDA 3650]